MANKFKTIWFTNPDDRESIENSLLYSPMVKRLREIIRDRLTGLENKEVSVETYKDQDWSYVQAHTNGRKQDLFFMLQLLDQGD